MTSHPLPDLVQHDTLPKLLALHARDHAGEVAMREKDFGIWHPITWAQMHERVRAFTLGLRQLGVGRGDVVGLIGDNRPDWVMGEIAAHAAGAMSLGIYRDALDEEVAYLIVYADVKVVFAEDEEQVDKLLNLGERIHTVKHIVYSDPRGMRKYQDPRLMPATDLVAMGNELLKREPGLYDRLVAEGQGEDVAVLCTTSGTTSNPKLAMLPAGRLLRHCASYLSADPKGPEDEYVSVLPLSWIMEQVYAVGMAMLSRMRVNFVEEAETMMHDFREIGPSFVLFAPRLWEQIAADVRAKVMDASPFKQKMFELGMKLGLEALAQGRRSWLADRILFKALRDRLGFTNLTSAATGGAALGPDTFRFFQALGVPLKQIYGQTETMGAYTVHRGNDVDFDTVGVPFDSGIEVKV
ncbi:MAG TPA: AMP-binding protein, partial [Ramlibacter sp.]|nr:AMP-binding protein [Ramlibacter sp.]